MVGGVSEVSNVVSSTQHNRTQSRQPGGRCSSEHDRRATGIHGEGATEEEECKGKLNLALHEKENEE